MQKGGYRITKTDLDRRLKMFLDDVPFRLPSETAADHRENVIHYDDLKYLEGVPFIVEVYRRLLKRDPDSEGLYYYTEKLIEGVPKEVIVEWIVQSIEAKNIGATVVGLPIRHKFSLRLRLIVQRMTILRWIIHLFELPTVLRRQAVLTEIFINRVNAGLVNMDSIGWQLEQMKNDNHQFHKRNIALLESMQTDLSVSMKRLNGIGNRLLEQETNHRQSLQVLHKSYLDLDEKVRSLDNNGIFSAESYRDFENEFRGSRAMIKDRQRRFLDILRRVPHLNKRLWVDIGCGRGEFLELLKEAGIPAIGVDLDESNVDMCRGLSLNALTGDGNGFLKAAAENSLSGISAFQVIEHLSSTYLRDFIESAFRSIQAGGLIILESINPYSLAALRTFWIDPTHVKPCAPDTIRFLLTAAGFHNAEIIYTSELPETQKLSHKDKDAQLLNDIIFSPLDYAVIGWKPYDQ